MEYLCPKCLDYFEEISNRLADIEFLSLEKDVLTDKEDWELRIVTASYYACPYVRMGKRLNRLYAEMLIDKACKRKPIDLF